VAALFAEPVQGEGGYIVPPPTYFARIRELCDRTHILLVVDEVQSGVGRTGKMFAIEHWGVEPDIIALAKGIASGMPLGATIARQSVMDWLPGAHANTFGGNPVSCAAAMATLDLIEDGLIENAATVGAYLREGLRRVQGRHRTLGDVRGLGLMTAAEMVHDPETKEPAPELRDALLQACYRRGMLLLGCGKSSVRFSPPLVVRRDQVDEALQILEEALAACEQGAVRPSGVTRL
jgi:4-aminobutyrate aminotransferase